MGFDNATGSTGNPGERGAPVLFPSYSPVVLSYDTGCGTRSRKTRLRAAFLRHRARALRSLVALRRHHPRSVLLVRLRMYLSAVLCCSLSSPCWQRGKPSRVALLPLACTWVLLGVLLSEIEPEPDPQTQLGLIADAGGAIKIDGEVTRTTPIRLTQSTLPFGNTTREEQSESLDLRVTSADGRPVAGGLRATLYGPADQAFPAIHCGDQVHTLIAMHLPERYLDPGVWDATAWLRQQGIGVVGSLKASGVTFIPWTRQI